MPAASPFLPPAQEWEAASHPDSSWRSNLALDLGLCLFSICQLLVLLEFRAHSGRSEKVPRGLRQRATSGRDLLSLDSTSPSCQEGSRLAKEHKASVPSGLLGIFSAKSPISPEQNPEVGRPGGGGGESCCSTAATPWCSVTGSCSPWHQALCRRVLASLICSQDTFSFHSLQHLQNPAGPLPLYPGDQHASAPQIATVLPAGIR